MDLTPFVDVAIGLTLVYLAASLFATIINEYIAQLLRWRAKQLKSDLLKLLKDLKQGDPLEIIAKLGANPALAPFCDPKGKPSSYVDPNLFARLLVGALRTAQTADFLVDIRSGINSLPQSGLKNQLSALANSSATNADEFVGVVSRWFDQTLTGMGEVYKKKLQWFSLLIGALIAGMLNIDTVTLTTHLWRDKTAREAAVAFAESIIQKTDQATFDACLQLDRAARMADTKCAPLNGLVETVSGRNKDLGAMPMGWPSRAAAFGVIPAWVIMTIGWLMTALAVSLGAPFWFDLLNRLVNVRHGMRRPEPIAPQQK